MSIASLWFLAFVGIVAVIYHLCAWVKLRQALLSAVNIGFLLTWVPNWPSWLTFALVIVGTYILVRLASIRRSGWFVFATIAALLTGFAILKHYSFLEWILPENLWKHPIELVGISYMLFKFIHAFVDQWQGQLSPLNFITYANYQLAFFTLVAGPIQRYNDFQRFWSEMGMAPEDSCTTLLCWNRILTGLIKIGPIATIAWYVFGQSGDRFDPLRTQNPLPWFLVYMYAYPVYLFFNFSGYTDVVIGAARLLGFQLPENFDRPYLARNVPDFWNRWHISLTHWIRDYVFMTSYKAAAERFPAWGKHLGWALLFLSLLLAGMWHGSTAGFIIFGALNGLGAACNQIYADLLKKGLGRSGFQAYQRNKFIQAVAIVLTLSFEAFSLLFFSSGVQKPLELMREVGNNTSWQVLRSLSPGPSALKLALVGVPIVILLLAGLYWKGKAILAYLAALRARLSTREGILYAFVLGKTALVTVALLGCWAFTEAEPVVVYMRF
jgi:D-alanyl-lipoteichoic acid acyltransferase DltB (MBOAT superfamily)